MAALTEAAHSWHNRAVIGACCELENVHIGADVAAAIGVRIAGIWDELTMQSPQQRDFEPFRKELEDLAVPEIVISRMIDTLSREIAHLPTRAQGRSR